MIRKCSCGKYLGFKFCRPWFAVSHGLCPACTARAWREIADMNGKRIGKLLARIKRMEAERFESGGRLHTLN